jgi:hypothetical protein
VLDCLWQRDRKLHKEETNNTSSATNITTIMVSRRMRQTQHVVVMTGGEACGNQDRLTINDTKNK